MCRFDIFQFGKLSIGEFRFLIFFLREEECCIFYLQKMAGSPIITRTGVVVGLNEVARKCETNQPGSLFVSIYPYV